MSGLTKEFTEAELLKREKEIEQRIEKAKQTREEFDEARYELVNDKGFRDEFEADIKKSRVSPRESLFFFEKREWLLVENNLRDIWYYSRIKRYL